MTDQQKNARFALAVLFGINLMNFFDRQIPGALSEPILREFAMNDAQWGAVNTVFTLMYAAVGIPLGRLADSRSRKHILGFGVTFWSLFTAISGLAWSKASFIFARIGVGLGEASCAPASQSMIGDLYPPERRARAMSLFMLGLPLGLFLAYRFAGLVYAHWGWRAAFFLACIPGLALAVCAFMMREPSRGTTEAHVAGAPLPTKQAFKRVLTIRTLWWIVASGLLFNFNSYSANTFQTSFLVRFHGLSVPDAATISSYSLGLAGVLGLFIGGMLGDRFRATRSNGRLLLAACTMSLAAPCVFFALQQPKGGTFVFGMLMALFSVMTYVYYSTVYSALQDVVEPRLRATAVAIYFFAQYVFGASFGTTITGALSDHFAHKAMLEAGASAMAPAFVASGLHTAMYIIPILTVLCAVSLFGAAGTVSKDMERMQRRLRGEEEPGAPAVVVPA